MLDSVLVNKALEISKKYEISEDAIYQLMITEVLERYEELGKKEFTPTFHCRYYKAVRKDKLENINFWLLNQRWSEIPPEPHDLAIYKKIYLVIHSLKPRKG